MKLTCLILVTFSVFAYAVKPGTYSHYIFDSHRLDQISIQTRWREYDAGAYLFAAYYFKFEAGPGGYIGTKIRGDKKYAAFSLWDTKSHSESTIPLGKCHRFGDEGTGTQCGLEYGWRDGAVYELVLKKVSETAEGVTWRGSIVDVENKRESIIGEIMLRNSNGYSGYGLLHPAKTQTFVEYFMPPNTCDNQPHVKLDWIGPFDADGNAAIKSIANYTKCPNNNVSSTERPITTHEAGGKTKMVIPANTDVWASLPP